MRVLLLEHVSVTSPEELEDEVTGWYRDLLGLEEMEKPPGTRDKGAWFRVGEQQVHITIDEHNPAKVSHFGMIVDDLADVVERLRTAGCHIEQASPIPGRRRFYTRDPAGNRLEIISIEDSARVVAFEETGSIGIRAEES